MKASSLSKIAIAVLPFVNMSTEDENEFLCDGITEEIIYALSKIDHLKVISRTSSFFYKQNKMPLKEIGSQLNVSLILEGSIRFSAKKIRIKTQLIDIVKDSQIWSESMDRDLHDIFEMQDEISIHIADEIREHFGHMEISDHLVESQTNHINAYKNFLKGKHLFNKWNPIDVHKAINYFEEAAEIDNNYIDALVYLADSYSFLAVAGFAPREETWMKAEEYINKAKMIDPNNASLNYILANHAFFTQADYASAMIYAQKSMQQKPNHPEAQQFISFLYMLKGDLINARRHLLYVKSIDPLSNETKFYEAYFYYRSQEYEKSENILNELLSLNSMNIPAIILLSYILILNQKSLRLNKLLANIPEELIMPDERLGLECLMSIKLNQHRKYSELIQLLENNATENSSFQAHAYLFLAYANINHKDAAFKMLEKLLSAKSSILLLAFCDPIADSLKTDNRFQAFHQKIFKLQKSTKPSKSKKVSLDFKTVQLFILKLNDFMANESAYLDPTINLRSLANQIEIHPNHLSWLLNEKLGKNFNEYINHLRIEHFKKLVIDPKNAHISLLGLAYESGFNSKTVFNTAFKRITGLTPKEYQKNHLNLN